MRLSAEQFAIRVVLQVIWVPIVALDGLLCWGMLGECWEHAYGLSPWRHVVEYYSMFELLILLSFVALVPMTPFLWLISRWPFRSLLLLLGVPVASMFLGAEVWWRLMLAFPGLATPYLNGVI